MTRTLRGRFDCKVDAKGRLSLPASLRSQFSGKSQQLVMTNALYKGKPCLDLFPLEEWKKLEKRISALPSLRSEVQAYQRFYISAGQNLEVDSHHRVLVPQSLRKFAHLEEEVVLIGMGHKIEIWPTSVWSQLQEELASQFDQIQEAVAALDEVRS